MAKDIELTAEQRTGEDWGRAERQEIKVTQNPKRGSTEGTAVNTHERRKSK